MATAALASSAMAAPHVIVARPGGATVAGVTMPRPHAGGRAALHTSRERTPVNHRFTSAALAVVGLVACAAPACAADFVIGPRAVDPPGGAPTRLGVTLSTLTSAWGAPTVSGDEIPVRGWRSLQVTFTSPSPGGRAVMFTASGSRWRTPQGIRGGAPVAALRRAYGGRLQGYVSPSGIQRFMVPFGRTALGFQMRDGRVALVFMGSTATVRSTLRSPLAH